MIGLLSWTTRTGGDGAIVDGQLPDEGAIPWLVRVALLLAAAVAAATEPEILHRSALRFHQAASLMGGGRAKRIEIALLIQLWLAAIALSMLAIMPAPWLRVAMLNLAMPAWICALSWSALFSVGPAFFLANAHAAGQALRLRRVGLIARAC
jgi:hypothetical protein